jgi:hypothetical protein
MSGRAQIVHGYGKVLLENHRNLWMRAIMTAAYPMRRSKCGSSNWPRPRHVSMPRAFGRGAGAVAATLRFVVAIHGNAEAKLARGWFGLPPGACWWRVRRECPSFGLTTEH